MQIRAKTLEEAYSKASIELKCSVVDIRAKVIQHPSNGILGLFKKEAIIELNNTSSVDRMDINKVCKIIKKDLTKILNTSLYEMEVKDVRMYNKDTIYILIDGEDTALVIGKEGSRYKALSYMLYNWVRLKYEYKVKLEISEFLRNQETMISKYLATLTGRIEKGDKVYTKPLDGILPLIAMEQLKSLYPDKYIAIRTNRYGKKVVVIDVRKYD